MANAEMKLRIAPANSPTDRVTFDVGGTSVTIPANDVLRLVLDKMLATPTAAQAAQGSVAPRIGAPWPPHGGIYAGVVRGDEGQPDYHLVVAPDAATDELNWKAATEWAATQWIEGYRDYTLPRRKEQSLLFGNVPELFEKTWYWSCAQFAGDDEYAWFQDFDDGDQSYDHKSVQLRARAVRRVPVQ